MNFIVDKYLIILSNQPCLEQEPYQLAGQSALGELGALQDDLLGDHGYTCIYQAWDEQTEVEEHSLHIITMLVHLQYRLKMCFATAASTALSGSSRRKISASW